MIETQSFRTSFRIRGEIPLSLVSMSVIILNMYGEERLETRTKRIIKRVALPSKAVKVDDSLFKTQSDERYLSPWNS